MLPRMDSEAESWCAEWLDVDIEGNTSSCVSADSIGVVIDAPQPQHKRKPACLLGEAHLNRSRSFTYPVSQLFACLFVGLTDPSWFTDATPRSYSFCPDSKQENGN